MSLTVVLPTDLEERVSEAAAGEGLNVDDFLRRLIESQLPTPLTPAQRLLLASPEERRAALAAAADDAADLYNTDLERAPEDRELTAFTILDSEGFEDEER